jgi:hypothetical protein
MGLIAKMMQDAAKNNPEKPVGKAGTAKDKLTAFAAYLQRHGAKQADTAETAVSGAICHACGVVLLASLDGKRKPCNGIFQLVNTARNELGNMGIVDEEDAHYLQALNVKEWAASLVAAIPQASEIQAVGHTEGTCKGYLAVAGSVVPIDYAKYSVVK